MLIPSCLNSSTISTLKSSMTKKLGWTVRCLVMNFNFVFDLLIVSWLYLSQSNYKIHCQEKSTKVRDKLLPLIDKVMS
jgi:hypothetical protein